MDERRAKAFAGEHADDLAEGFELGRGEGRVVLAARQVRVHPLDPHRPQARQLPDQGGRRLRPHADAPHAGVHLHVDVDVAAQAQGDLGHAPGALEGGHDRGEVVGHGRQHAFEGIERAQDEDGELQARFAQGHPLLDGGDSEPVGGAGLLSRARALRGAVAVRVGLDHEHHLRARRHLGAQAAEVPDEGGQVDLGPGRTEEAAVDGDGDLVGEGSHQLNCVWESEISGGSSPRASSAKRVMSRRNRTSTVPVGPWRCLAMMSWALFSRVGSIGL